MKVPEAVKAEAVRAANLLSPSCDACQVAYVDGYEGACQEPLPPYTDPAKHCPGKVGLRPADIAVAALEAALEQLREELERRFEQNVQRCREVASGEPEQVASTLATAAETWSRAKDELNRVLGDKEKGS